MNRNNTLYRVQNKPDVTLDENATLGILQHLDKDTLEQLNDSDEKLKELIQDDAQLKKWENEKEMLITSNKSLADYNMSKKPKINQGKELLAIEYEKLGRLKEEYDTLISAIASSAQAPSLELAHALLQTKAAESEEQTDSISEDYLDKKIDCDTFMEQYIERRKITHLLKLKSEKLGEMIQHHLSNDTWGGSTSPQRSTPNLAPQTSARPPYPMYGMGMPHAPSPYMPPVSN